MFCTVRGRSTNQKGNNANGRASSVRYAALVLALCFVVVLILSYAIILTHYFYGHDRNGVGGACVGCIRVISLKKLIKHIDITAAAIGITFVILSEFPSNSYGSVIQINQPSPIGLKVKLNF